MKQSKLDYHQYADFNRDQIIAKMRTMLKPNRLEHCLRVEQTAIELATEQQADPTVAGLAGLVHDYAKQRPKADFEAVIQTDHLDPELLNYGSAIWHGYVGYLMVQRELGINDNRILRAVKYHTIGAPVMDVYAQIVYMADYIEPGRDFAGVTDARKLTHARLWDGVVYQNAQTMKRLVTHEQAVYPAAIAAYNVIVAGQQ
ncbi:bis(5'-nucleosyl)-tetraphosphatase (symmetrical) YqeK [Fructilactobacillus myrtifloralis]|uniref:bis(5'-nucleosyl)-tetraphosphatase (symmetrical) n=1 Tax=Fructilactobacillus myrtifloralis TaxID=2940301 RepID=A0ABY5BQQ2_9LACO|nr:bis(5'-nucleosyl)-tetraphosphatase (symmetrical) YqeK [Fructilactobacillus myrtifloralis]USS85251.1 bis(5'-nucleosyl)-tetraphosphatase (symmetrical) YqeK [Fructilactobacillus myrtifloralis]